MRTLSWQCHSPHGDRLRRVDQEYETPSALRAYVRSRFETQWSEQEAYQRRNGADAARIQHAGTALRSEEEEENKKGTK